MLSYSVIFRD